MGIYTVTGAASGMGKAVADKLRAAGHTGLRTNATTAEWAGAGIRLNAIAPGAILTPLLQEQLKDPATADAIQRFPVPIGGYGDPSAVGDWVVFMLAPSAAFLCGSIIYVDGGTDAYFRPSDWPKAPGFLATISYLRRMRAFRPYR